MEPDQHPFPWPHECRATTMFIETQVYLEAVLREFAEFSQLESIDEPVNY